MFFFLLSVFQFHKELSYSVLGVYDLYSSFQFGSSFLGTAAPYSQFLSKCAVTLCIVAPTTGHHSFSGHVSSLMLCNHTLSFFMEKKRKTHSWCPDVRDARMSIPLWVIFFSGVFKVALLMSQYLQKFYFSMILSSYFVYNAINLLGENSAKRRLFK